jgi:hypothetical protein
MTPRQHIERFARRAPGGGIAWENPVFERLGVEHASACLDAAVDLAWEYLTPPDNAGEPQLMIHQEGELLIIRLEARSRAAGIRVESAVSLAA